MKKIGLVLAIALALPALAQAVNLDEAHRAFAEGRYHDSSAAYRAVLAEKGYSAPVLFDLGNSLFREGDLAQAILAYKRAQWLAPGDPDIAANLRQAEAKAGRAGRDAEPLRPFHPCAEHDAVGVARWRGLDGILPEHPGPHADAADARALCPVGALGAIVLGGVIAAIAFSSQALGQVVVMNKDAAALISPFPAAQKVFAPSPGETVTVEKAYDDYFLVNDSAGHSGWIAKSEVEPVVPSA